MLSILGACLGYACYDIVGTGTQTVHLYNQGNTTAAQSSVLHFGGRTTGMFVGAAAGVKVGAALGVESGPGMFVTGAIGGVAGAVGGDYLMDAADRQRIYNQRDSNGNSWSMNPEHPEQSWTLRASPELANRLSYQASGVALSAQAENLRYHLSM